MHQQPGGSRRDQADPYPYQQQPNPHQQQPYPPYQEQRPNPYQQPDGYYGPPGAYAPPPPPRRKRRVFMWVFFAVQALFLIWLIAGLATTGHTAPSAAEMAQYCGTGPKSVLALYNSRADCMSHYSRILSDAAGTGRGLGAALIIVFWVVVDFFLGLGYVIYRLATRSR